MIFSVAFIREEIRDTYRYCGNRETLFLQFPLARWDRSAVHAIVRSNPRFPNASAANCLVNSAAGSSRPRRAAWPDQNGVKSVDPAISDFARSGASAAAA